MLWLDHEPYCFDKNHLAHRVTAVDKDVVPIASNRESDSEVNVVSKCSLHFGLCAFASELLLGT